MNLCGRIPAIPVALYRADVIFPTFRFLSQMVFSFSKKVNCVCNKICCMMWLFWNFAVACFYLVCVCLFGSVHNEAKQILFCPVWFTNVWDYALVLGSFWNVSPVPRAGVKIYKCQFSARPILFFFRGFRYLHFFFRGFRYLHTLNHVFLPTIHHIKNKLKSLRSS